MNISAKPLLIDTHILILMIAASDQLHEKDKKRIQTAVSENSLYVCTISFWEIAMLSCSGRLSLGIPLQQWIQEILNISGLHVIDLSIPILLESVQLPNECHKDPADRMIIAAARVHDYPLLSYDQKIIHYAELGYLKRG
mgnify:CR=1 FL=1